MEKEPADMMGEKGQGQVIMPQAGAPEKEEQPGKTLGIHMEARNTSITGCWLQATRG